MALQPCAFLVGRDVFRAKPHLSADTQTAQRQFHLEARQVGRQPPSIGPALGSTVTTQCGIATFGLGISLGDRRFQVLEAELQLLVGQPFRLPPELQAPQLAHWHGMLSGASDHPPWHYISTSRPTSTTWAAGTPKYTAGRLAFRCIVANTDFLQTAMPDALPVEITITRLK